MKLSHLTARLSSLLSRCFGVGIVVKGPCSCQREFQMLLLLLSQQLEGGAAMHRGSVRASHLAAPGLNPGSAKIFSDIFTAWFVNSID